MTQLLNSSSILLSLPPTLHTSLSSSYTPYFSLFLLHSILLSLPPTLHTSLSSSYTPYFSLFLLRSILLSLPPTQHAVLAVPDHGGQQQHRGEGLVHRLMEVSANSPVSASSRTLPLPHTQTLGAWPPFSSHS